MSLNLRHAARAFWITALATLAVDQAAKAAVRASLIPGESMPLLGKLLNLTYVRNSGAAFGLFPGRQAMFIATSLIVLFVIGAYWRHARPTQAPIVFAIAFIASGAAGNLIDRALIGRVTDFFEFGFIDFPVFNVADCAIVVGVGVLIAWLLFGPEPARPGASLDAALPAESAVDGPASQDAPAGEL